MDGDIAQNTAQRTYFKVFMVRDSNVVLTFYGSGKSYVTAGLPGYFIAVFFEKFCKFLAADSRGSFILLLLHLLLCVNAQYGDFLLNQSGILSHL